MSQIAICPTVTAFGAHDYRQQMELLETFANRVHIDLMDGVFAPTKSPDLGQIWLSEKLVCDVHLMYKQPATVLEQLINLKPNLVIIHAEAEGYLADIARSLKQAGIKAGLGVLQSTSVDNVQTILSEFDHVMIFSGNLGYHGGSTVDFDLLEKARQIKTQFPSMEIGWDGGVNDQNAKQLVEGGVDVLNVGGYIHKANHPKASYEELVNLTGQAT
jgi:ribulose-phosphate 3-epimerase